MTKSSIKKYLYALLLTSAVLALGACSSSDEQPTDDTQEACAGGGPRGDDGICCDLSQMQGGCPLTE
jgi:hypothetical protein